MALVLALFNVPYLYTQDETQLNSCYQENAVLYYNVAVGNIRIDFTPTGNDDCKVFPKTIEAALVVETTDFTIQRKIIRNFNYSTTNFVQFDGLPKRSVVLGQAMLFLFSFTEITSILVENAYFSAENLAQCFSTDSYIQIGSNRATLVFLPTGHCTSEFSMVSYANFAPCDLVIEETVFKFLALKLCQEYANGLQIEINIAGDFSVPLSSVVINAYVVFTFNAHTTAVFHHHFHESVKVVGFESVTNAQGQEIGLFDTKYRQVGLFDDEFIVRVSKTSGADFELFRPVLEAITFTHFAFRFSIENADGEVLQLQKTYYRTTFFDTLNFLIFGCETAKENIIEQCRDFFSSAQINGAVFMLDVMFFSEQTLKVLEKMHLEQIPSCWARSVIDLNAQNICLEFVKKETIFGCAKAFSGQAKLFRVVIEELSNERSSNLLTYTFTAVISNSVQRHCLPVDDLGSDLNFTNTGLFITITEPVLGDIGMIYASRLSNSDYRLVTLIPCVIGAVYVGICLLYTVFGLIDGIKTVINAKKLIKK